MYPFATDPDMLAIWWMPPSSPNTLSLATGTRRHLVNERGVPKANITFCGYWKAS